MAAAPGRREVAQRGVVNEQRVRRLRRAPPRDAEVGAERRPRHRWDPRGGREFGPPSKPPEKPHFIVDLW